jgi:hypothetical protein
MPLDEGIGCLGVALRALWAGIEFVLELSHLGDLLGYLGSWTVRLVTLNRCKPDPESWNAIIIGFVVLVALCIVFGMSKLR